MKIPDQARLILSIVVMAALAALTAVAFLSGTHWVFEAGIANLAKLDPLTFVWSSFLLITTLTLVAGLLMIWGGRLAVGSGIPQLKAAYWNDTGNLPWKAVIAKFFGGILSVGGGVSLGREGPTLFFGAGVAAHVSRLFGVPAHLRRAPAAIGATAGLAAAFNTPLAAITFVLEEILGDLASRAIGRMIVASVVGAFVVYGLIGPQPSFLLPPINQVSWVIYAILPVVAVVSALLGVAFHKGTLALRGRVKARWSMPLWLGPVLGGWTTWLLAIPVFLFTGHLGVFGLGYDDLSAALDNQMIWWIAGILVVAKLGATIASYALGGCGGVFSPLLFLGGASGFFVAGFASFLGVPLTPGDHTVLAAVGMATCLAAVLRTPLSSLLIVFEMTHQFAMVPGLLLGLFVAGLVSRWVGGTNLYDGLLVQDGYSLHRVHPPTDLGSWREVPLASLAPPTTVVLTTGFEATWKKTVASVPYKVFPVVQNGSVIGALRRTQVENWSPDKPAPVPIAVKLAAPEDPLEKVEAHFAESDLGVVILVDEAGQLAGMVTLHDLLRAQASVRD